MKTLPKSNDDENLYDPQVPKKVVKKETNFPDIFKPIDVKATQIHESLYRRGKLSHRYGRIKEQTGFSKTDLTSDSMQKMTEGINQPNINGDSTSKMSQLSLSNSKKIAHKDLIGLKRDIFRSRLSIDIKNESTQKLEEYLSNEESALNSRVADMDSDYAWIKHYIRMLGDEVQKLVDEGKTLEAKRVVKTKEFAKLKNGLFHVDIEIREMQDELKVHSSYRDFMELITKMGQAKKYQKMKEEMKKQKLEEKLLYENKLLAEKLQREESMDLEKSVKKPKRFNDEGRKSNIFMTNPGLVDSPRRSRSKLLVNQNSKELCSTSRIDLEENGSDTEDDFDYIKMFKGPEEFLAVMRKIESDNQIYIRNLQNLEEDINKQTLLASQTTKNLSEKLESQTSNIDEIKKRKEDIEKSINTVKAKNWKTISSDAQEKNDQEVFSIFKNIRDAANRFCDKREIEYNAGSDIASQYSKTLHELKCVQNTFMSFGQDYYQFGKNHKKKFEEIAKQFSTYQKRDLNLKQQKEAQHKLEELRDKQMFKGDDIKNVRKGRRIMGRHFLETKQKESKEVVLNEDDLEEEKYFV